MPKSDIPFGDCFSPGRKVDLGDLLALVANHESDPERFLFAVYEALWSTKADGSQREPGGGKGKESTGDGLSLATNTLYSLRAYGLAQSDVKQSLTLTDKGRELLALKHDRSRMLHRFAQHILTSCRGLDVINTVKDMEAGGHSMSIPAIAKHLQERGIYVPEGGTHLNTMGQWLREAGILRDGWDIDQAQLDDILGIEEPTLDAFADLDAAQIAFARGLARLNVDDISSEKVREYAADIYGVEFPVKSLPKSILEPLERAGLITSEKTTGGRGSKPHVVRPTKLLRMEVTDPILDSIAQSVGAAKYRKLIRKGLAEILNEMSLPPEETHKRGLALEALALYLTRIIGLEFRGWRSAPADRSYEIDALVEGTRLIFSRWQIQCKISARNHATHRRRRALVRLR